MKRHAILPLATSSYSYQAAIFLLTSSSILWSAFENHIEGEHICFSDVHRRNLTVKDYITMQFANDLLSDRMRMTYGDLADRNVVSEGMFRLYLKALAIKRYGIDKVAACE